MTNQPQPVPFVPNYIGRGQYIAFDNYFACRDERKSNWRMSRLTINPDTSFTFTYVGAFLDERDVMSFIRNKTA